MTNYYQETNSRVVFALPDEVTYPLPTKPTDETIGRVLYAHYFPLPQQSALFRNAWKVVREINNQDIAKSARELLITLQDTLAIYQQSGFDLSHLPPLHAFFVNDGSILFEWIFNDFRIGFNIEANPNDSGWYLVSNRKLGEISASGYMGVEINKLIILLLSFILTNS